LAQNFHLEREKFHYANSENNRIIVRRFLIGSRPWERGSLIGWFEGGKNTPHKKIPNGSN
jgi:hypothetical protein